MTPETRQIDPAVPSRPLLHTTPEARATRERLLPPTSHENLSCGCPALRPPSAGRDRSEFDKRVDDRGTTQQQQHQHHHVPLHPQVLDQPRFHHAMASCPRTKSLNTSSRLMSTTSTLPHAALDLGRAHTLYGIAREVPDRHDPLTPLHSRPHRSLGRSRRSRPCTIRQHRTPAWSLRRSSSVGHCTSSRPSCISPTTSAIRCTSESEWLDMSTVLGGRRPSRAPAR